MTGDIGRGLFILLVGLAYVLVLVLWYRLERRAMKKRNNRIK